MVKKKKKIKERPQNIFLTAQIFLGGAGGWGVWGMENMTETINF